MPTEAMQLEDVQKEVEQIDSALVAVRRDIRSYTASIGELEQERKSITVKLVDGDRKAESELAEIEKLKKEFGNKVEGLEQKALKLEAELKDACNRRIEAAHELNRTNAREKTAKLAAQAAKLMGNQIAHWRSGCRIAHELRLLLVNVEDAKDLSQVQKNEIREAARQLHAAQIPANENWKTNYRSEGGWKLLIVPSAPPDSLRHLEKLK